MKLSYRFTIAILIFFLADFSCTTGFTRAQSIPIGSWKEYLPYNNPIALTASDSKVYCISGGKQPDSGPYFGVSLFSVNKSDFSYERYSKVNGLSDIVYNAIAFDKTHQVLLIAYTNSNIDLMEGDKVINIPDIKRKNIVGDKAIYQIFFWGDYAYLSCGFGIVVIDLVKNEIHDTFYIGPGGTPLRVNSISADGENFYAATALGVFMADINSPNLAYYANWTNVSGKHGLPAGESSSVLSANNKTYTVIKNVLYQRNDTSWISAYSQQGWTIRSMSPGIHNDIILSEINSNGDDYKLTMFSASGQTDSLRSNLAYPLNAYQDNDGAFWVANLYSGLTYIKDGTGKNLIPNGPNSSKVSDIAIYNHNVYVATGGVSAWVYTYNRDGFYARIYDSWKSYNQYVDGRMDTTLDVFITAVNPVTQLAYFGSYGGGLIEFNNGSITNIYKQNSSLTGQIGNGGSYLISGIAFDKDGNMWVSDFGGPVPIALRTMEGKWYGFIPNVDMNGGFAGPVTVDQNNYKWIVLEQQNGILVYDSGDKIDDPSDDRYRTLSMGVGKGGLPTLAVHCVAEDKDGQMWVGTDQGVAVFYCTANIFDADGCDAQQILVKQDQYYNYLLINDVINDIAIDGANRKWFATNSGAYLMSADGSQQIYHFDVDNSPLFSNNITSVAIDDKNGEVFFGTDKGLIVFRSGALDEGTDNCAPLVFPNPVKKDYAGPIAIKGLVSNSEVKITDVSGHLVYQTKALGTQAIWDGKTLSGSRAASGVYLIYAASPDGEKSCMTKLVLIN